MPRRSHTISRLFAKRDLREALESQKVAVKTEIRSIPPASLTGTPERLAAELVTKYTFQVPELTEGAISISHEEVEVDVAGSWERDLEDHPGPYFVPGHAITYHVPFVGAAGLFRVSPSRKNLTRPPGVVQGQELALRYERADANVAETKAKFDRDIKSIHKYLGWIREDIEKFEQQLEQLLVSEISRRQLELNQAQTGLAELGFPIRRNGFDSAKKQAGLVPSKQLKTEQATHSDEHYDVALSFAGEDRLFVEQVADLLLAAGIAVFYDGFEKDRLWGKDLITHLAEIYQKRSRFVVMFISRHYVEKAWPSHERKHAQARALHVNEEYILPARFDDTEVPGLPPTVGYVDLRGMSAVELADLIRKKLDETGAA